MERKWTPGPWRIGKPHPTNACLYIQPIGQYGDIATLYGADGDHQEQGPDGDWSEQPVRGANALLIAAAPDLYEALEMAEQFLCGGADGSEPAMIAARAALAKARGEV